MPTRKRQNSKINNARTLPVKEVQHFYQLHWQILAYINRKFDIIPNLKTRKEFEQGPDLQDVEHIRQKLYSTPDLLQLYATENPDNLNMTDLEIIRSWQHFKQGSFYIVRHLKNVTIFIDHKDDPLAYGVTSLFDDLADSIAYPLPLLLNAVLLPWNGKIIYDGILNIRPITFGGSIRRDVNRTYQEAKTKHGLVQSLPYAPQQPSDEQLLKGYLKSQESRFKHHEEIFDLMKKNLTLRNIYHQETGKAAARRLGKDLRRRGLNPGWFAIYKEMIIASGTTEKEAKEMAQKIVPEYDVDGIYYFHFKK